MLFLLLTAVCSVAKIGNDKRVLNAMEIVAEYWNDDYEKRNIDDKYLEIVINRIINIKNNIDPEKIYEKDDLFKVIDYTVEFELISNYWDSALYNPNVMQSNFVVVYKDGTTKVFNNLFNMYIKMHLCTDSSW